MKLIAGGSTQNSIRTAQWVFNFYDKKQTFFLGSVGEDQYAVMLDEQAKKDSVKPLYFKVPKLIVDKNNNLKFIEQQQTESNENRIQDGKETKLGNKLDCTKTGICLAFNTNNGLYRSMVTFLGAAKQLNSSHCDKFMNEITKSSLVYIGGFLLTSSFDAVTKLCQFCHDNNKKFALNLSAPYVCSNFHNLITQLIPNLDLIFCNEKELREFANCHHFGVS